MRRASNLARCLKISGLLFISIPLILAIVAVLVHLTSKVDARLILLPWTVLTIIGIILLFVSRLISMTKDIVEVKSRIKYVLLEILVWLVPVLIYFYIKPDLNKPLTFKTNYIQYLLIISTVLLGFVITALGIRYRIPKKISQDLVERKTLDLMQAFLPMSAIIGFVEIILILRWLAVPDDFFLGIIILLFSFQIMFTLTASFPYLFFIFPQKPKK
jgi:hypothetical protein